MEDKTQIQLETSLALAPNEIQNGQLPPRGIHPYVLLAHWEIHSRAGRWQAACAIAQALITALPDQPLGWLCRSFALQQLGQIQEAWRELLPAARRFAADWRIAYSLACYACQAGDTAGAWHWLGRAIKLGDGDLIKSAAMDEPSFQPLWELRRSPPPGQALVQE